MPGFTRELGIDLGTSNTVIVEGQQIQLNEPSTVSILLDEWKMIEWGQAAKEMFGRVPEDIEVIVKMINISKTARDIYGSLISIGMVSYILFAIFQNIGMTIKLMPITGIPLPFISHGGTFLLINMVGIGIALSVNYHKDGLNF